MSRPSISAELERRVLCEAGHRCAIHTCREIIEVDIHHIVPWSKCKEHNYENLIALCPNCHRLADRGRIDRKSLRMYKANLEAGHRCAIHTCREIIEVDIHHIVPWSKCKEHNYENLIALCPNCHRLADRGRIDRKSLRMYKANLRYAHDRFSQLEVDLLFQLYKIPESENDMGVP